MAADQTPAPRHGPTPASTGSLGPHVVGRRVVVRRIVPGETGPTGGPAMTDVLGICESWTGGVVAVRRERGDLVEIPTAEIVSGKPVPPRPPGLGGLDPEEADRRALAGWQPMERASVGAWVLRASGGFSRRGNSVLALGDPGTAPAEAVRRVGAWYGQRSLRPRAHVHPGSAVAAAFGAAGWTSEEPTLLMLAPVSRALRRSGPSAEADVRHTTTVDEGWLAVDERAARHGDAARAVLEAGEVTFASLRDQDGAVLARGRGAVHDDWVGISSLWTRPDLRGSGLGRPVLRSLLEWGAGRGATTTYLQVVEANEAARRLYEARGYDVHHRYTYLAAPA